MVSRLANTPLNNRWNTIFTFSGFNIIFYKEYRTRLKFMGANIPK
jgi:hypothetical protein